jgi:hypothetical protein
MFKYNYNSHPLVTNVTSAQTGNEITRDYYWHLVGEINRGTKIAAVCRVENLKFGVTSYHLISY